MEAKRYICKCLMYERECMHCQPNGECFGWRKRTEEHDKRVEQYEQDMRKEAGIDEQSNDRQA